MAEDLRVGPLGLAFFDDDPTQPSRLVVGSGGGLKENRDLVRIFKLPADGAALKADDAKEKRGPIDAKKCPPNGAGWFYSVVATPAGIFATSHGAGAEGWICRVSLLDHHLADIGTYIPAKPPEHPTGPIALTLGKRGELVVGEAGRFDHSTDSLLTFYHPVTRKPLMSLPTGLRDVVGLAYSPEKNNPEKPSLLYAVDLSWADESQGGLYRLDSAEIDGKPGLKAVKIVALERPTSLCFARDGSLYVTLLGPAKTGDSKDKSAKKTGRLVKITGGL